MGLNTYIHVKIYYTRVHISLHKHTHTHNNSYNFTP